METVNKRVVNFLNYMNVKEKDLRRILKLNTHSNLSAWWNDKIEFPDRYIIKIIQIYPELNANWLITGNGPMLNDMSGVKESYKDRLWNPPLSVNDDQLSVKMYSCPDCLWREKIIEGQKQTISVQEKLINTLQKKQEGEKNGIPDDSCLEKTKKTV